MEKPVININIKNLVGRLVIVCDGDKTLEVQKQVNQALLSVINSVSEIQLENSDKSEKAKDEMIQDLKKREEELKKDWLKYQSIQDAYPSSSFENLHQSSNVR